MSLGHPAVAVGLRDAPERRQPSTQRGNIVINSTRHPDTRPVLVLLREKPVVVPSDDIESLVHLRCTGFYMPNPSASRPTRRCNKFHVFLRNASNSPANTGRCIAKEARNKRILAHVIEQKQKGSCEQAKRIPT